MQNAALPGKVIGRRAFQASSVLRAEGEGFQRLVDTTYRGTRSGFAQTASVTLIAAIPDVGRSVDLVQKPTVPMEQVPLCSKNDSNGRTSWVFNTEDFDQAANAISLPAAPSAA